MEKVIGVIAIESGEILNHASASIPGDYHTLCGLSLTDDLFERVDIPRKSKITCQNCFCIWSESLRFRENDFA